MADCIVAPENGPTKTVADGETVGPAVKPRGRAPRRSNLIDELVKARVAEFRSVPNLAEMADVAPEAIVELEAGRGPVATLTAVFKALPFKVAGLAQGEDLAEKLRNRRDALELSVEELAVKAALLPDQIVELEAGEGSVENLLSLLATVAPKVRRHAQERSHWGPGDKKDRDARFTPERFLKPMVEVFGPIDLDPCGHALSPVAARRRFLLAEGDDGLKDPWSGRLVFMNPPYSGYLPWMTRAYGEWSAGRVEVALCLVPVRTDSDFFQTKVAAAADIYLLRGGLPFSNRAGKSRTTPFSLMLVAYGITDRQKANFAKRVPGLWVKASAVAADLARQATSIGWRKVRGRPVWRTVSEARCDCPFKALDSQWVRVCCGPRTI
ncbi:phage N-6-adenine-methyltransferase [Sphingomonas radiodurans]|uniref:phage N-6-adenine-methyltransferase n=1 Tax=Sphingomonas radiodurans TaxID=2890321 RepID=UPI001E2B626D|nr:phage N-6-adenine-methyltransferase [Sphingomonas radiodurans]WBH15818.1 phage N-6-adenine-methyltransferase [Sphingomonas radiodurans]